MRYLGIDYGSKRVGLALSDESGSMGFPHSVVATGDARAAVKKIYAEGRVDAVVIGESRDLLGAENPIAREAKEFAAWIEHELSLPIHWEPEVYTSAEARRAPSKEGKTRKPSSHAPVDSSAAALILTSYLSHTHGT
jgi:putative Holliday junction resolvase